VITCSGEAFGKLPSPLEVPAAAALLLSMLLLLLLMPFEQKIN
jgi:hypothetical protein